MWSDVTFAERIEILGEKVSHGRFFSDVKEVAHERSRERMRAGYMTKSSEAYVCAVQDQELRTRIMRAEGVWISIET